MIKVKLVGSGYHGVDKSKLPVVVMAVEHRITQSDGSVRVLWMVDGDFIPEVNPGAGVFAGDWIPFYPGEVVPL